MSVPSREYNLRSGVVECSPDNNCEESVENIIDERQRAMDAEQVATIISSINALKTSVESLRSSTVDSQRDIERLSNQIQLNSDTAAITHVVQHAPQTPQSDTLSTSDTSQSTVVPVPVSDSSVKLYDLPAFSGNAEEWPLFLANYKDTTAAFKYSQRQNLMRLHKSLTGPAKEAVASMLIYPQDVPNAIEELEFRFGRPDLLVRHQLSKIQQFPVITENKIEHVLSFSTKVRNVVAFLTSANCQQHLSNTSLLEQLVGKLPTNKQYEWIRHAMTIEPYPTVADFSKWLSELARVICLMPPTQTSHKGSVAQLQQPQQPRRIMHVNENTNAQQGQQLLKCYECGEAHSISDCNIFNQTLDVQTRWEKVKSLRLCFSCLRKGHNTTNCRSKKFCGVQGCRRYHHRSLHDEQSTVRPGTFVSMPNEPAQHLLNCRLTQTSTNLLFKILPVTLFGPNGKFEVFAMFDDGSAITIVEEVIANKLGLKGQSQPLTLQWYGERVTTEPSSVVNLEIRGHGESTNHMLKNVRTVRNLDLPVQSFKKSDFQHLSYLPLKDYESVKPVILLGLDNVQLGVSSTTVQSVSRDAIAVKTRLGWVAYGPTKFSSTSTPIVLHIREKQPPDDLHNMVEEYFAADNFGMNNLSTTLESEDNKLARQILLETTHRVGNRFETGLLWKAFPPALPNSLQMAERRLAGIERKMSLDAEFATKYRREMSKYFERGYARKLSEEELRNTTQPVWYLPHFAVQSPHKPDKLRIVFDAAATVKGTSLNSVLLKGPEQVKSLMNIMFKFREGVIAAAADIREMFSQIQIRPEDQQVQRFLWRTGDIVEHHAMVSMIFGAICSPCSAEFVKNRNAEEFKYEYPDAAEAIVNLHYVDDFVASFRNEEEAIRICREVVKVNAEASFDLRNFSSNSSSLQSTMNREPVPDASTVNMERQAHSEKVLGMFWNTEADVFEFKTKFHRIPKEVLEDQRPPTKRELLGIVMAIFDPYGFLADFLLFLKVLIRDTWKSKIAWNDPLTIEIHKKWIAWWKEFQNINLFAVHRCYSRYFQEATDIQLHIFADASQIAFAAAGYFRIVHAQGVDVVFVFGKTRGAPQKLMSIPRLELQAAVLGTRLSKVIIRNHDINISRVTYWTDSKTILYWINSVERKFKAFVGHRISEILTTTQPSQWSFIPTDKNSADAATRASWPPKLKPKGAWLSGPTFLKEPEESWPEVVIEPPPDQMEEEVKPCLILQPQTGNYSIIEFNRFSSYLKIKRTMAWVLRAVNKFLDLRKDRSTTANRGPLTTSELNKAEHQICRMVQQEQYDKEIATLRSHGRISKHSSIYSLRPYLDENNILRIQGRIDEAYFLPFDARRPILMPQTHFISELIMRYFHEKYHHQNIALILNEARQKFWFPHIRSLLKVVQRRCLVCKIERAKPIPPLMGQLPPDRLTPYVRPFTYTGVDLFGPFYVAIGRRREKRWAVIFTCLTVRAAHLELAENLSTDAFIICLRNFINRRGTPVRIRSDNGTNFIGAQKELKEAERLLDTDRLSDEATSRNIEWLFNCPANPSSGGCWERLIRIVKCLLKKTLLEEAPRVETLRSVLIEAENIINSRPLTDISLTIEDDEPLTPNHFLIGCVNSTQTPHPADEKICLKKQWRISQNLKDRLWKKWTVEYLPQLLKRPKWNDKVRPLQVNDLVIICDSNQPRSRWQKGRIIRVFPAKDGQIRFAEVKTSSGTIRRPATKLAVLTIDGESLGDSRGEECKSTL